MAINSTQSTGDILANRQQARRDALLNTAEQVVPRAGLNLDASNPIGLISQSLSGAGNALTAGTRRAAEQQNLDRQQAIRQEAQQYARGQDAQKREDMLDQRQYQRGQDALTQNRADRRLAQEIAYQQATQARQDRQEARTIEDRRAAIAKEKRAAVAQENIAQYDTERTQAYADAKIDPNSAGFQVAKEINLYDAGRAERGDNYSAANEFASAHPALKGNAAARQVFDEDIEDGLTQAKKTAGKSWDSAYEQLAIERALKNTPVGSGWLSIDGNIDEEGFRDAVVQEMANVLDAKATAKDIQTIETDHARKVAKENLAVSRAGIRNK